MKFIKTILEYNSEQLLPVSKDEFFERFHNLKSEAFTQNEIDDISSKLINSGYHKQTTSSQLDDNIWYFNFNTKLYFASTEDQAMYVSDDRCFPDEKELVTYSYLYISSGLRSRKGNMEAYKTEDGWIYFIHYYGRKNEYYIIDIYHDYDKFLNML